MNSESTKQNKLKLENPYVYSKCMKFDEKLSRGESVAIIQFQYNYQCNFQCKHCSIKRFQENENGKRSFTIDDVKKLSKEADELGLAHFVITGGEPLTFKDYDELVAAIDPKKFYITSDTNGWFLDEKRAKHLKDIGISKIQLSLDSLDAKEHDEFRNKTGSHERAIKSIDYAQKAGLDIIVQTVVWKERVKSNEFENFVKYLNGRNVPVFVTFAKPVGAWEGNLDNLIDKNDMKYIEDMGKRYNVFTHLTPSYGHTYGCIAVKRMISVTQYGDVLPCPYIHVSIGNVFTEPLKDIIDRGFKIKWFGEYQNTCMVAEDRDFIEKYIKKGVYGKSLPVKCEDVFSKEDETKIPFYKTISELTK